MVPALEVVVTHAQKALLPPPTAPRQESVVVEEVEVVRRGTPTPEPVPIRSGPGEGRGRVEVAGSGNHASTAKSHGTSRFGAGVNIVNLPKSGHTTACTAWSLGKRAFGADVLTVCTPKRRSTQDFTWTTRKTPLWTVTVGPEPVLSDVERGGRTPGSLPDPVLTRTTSVPSPTWTRCRSLVLPP